MYKYKTDMVDPMEDFDTYGGSYGGSSKMSSMKQDPTQGWDPYANSSFASESAGASPYTSHIMQNSSSGGEAAGQSAAVSGASGAMVGGPAGAAIGVGGSLLVNYLQSEARRKEKMKDDEMKLALQHGQDQSNIMGNLMNNWRAALSRG